MNDTPIPNTLREHRKKAGLTVMEVARALGFTSAERISAWEKGQSYPHITNLAKLSKLFGVQVHALYQNLFYE